MISKEYFGKADLNIFFPAAMKLPRIKVCFLVEFSGSHKREHNNKKRTIIAYIRENQR